MTAREAGSIFFWAAIEIFLLFFRNTQVTCINPNTPKRARTVFIQGYLYASTSTPVPAPVPVPAPALAPAPFYFFFLLDKYQSLVM